MKQNEELKALAQVVSRKGLFSHAHSLSDNSYPWAKQIIDALWDTFWTPKEFSFMADKSDFHSKMTKEQQGVFLRTLAAISQVEVAPKYFWADLRKMIPHHSIANMGLVAANNEVIHNEAYRHLPDFLGLGSAFDDAASSDALKGRLEYLSKHNDAVYTDDHKQFVYSLILFTLFIENVSLFGQFYIIMHFHDFENVMKDTAQQVAYTRLEETLHAKAGVMLINTIRDEYPELFDDEMQRRIAWECEKALMYERKLIEWILDGYEKPNLSADIVMTFNAKRMNDCMKEVGFAGVDYDRDLINKTEWMDAGTNGNVSTDFFHKKPVEYSAMKKSIENESLW